MMRAEWYKRRIGGFARDESGQSLVFAALTLFCLTVMTLMVVGIGEVTSAQIRLQHAADAAAYAGGQVESDCLAHIAWCNHGMSTMYYHCLRYAADNVALSVRAELVNPEPWWLPEMAGGAPDPDAMRPVCGVYPLIDPGIDPATAWAQAQDFRQNQAEPVLKQGEAWMMHLSRIERGIAAIAPTLIEHQIYHSAHTNYYGDPAQHDGEHQILRVAMYPHFSYIPDGPSKVDLNIEKISGGIEGWRLTSNTNPDYMVESLHTLHVPGGAGGVPASEDMWQIAIENGDTSYSVTFYERYREPHAVNGEKWDDGWYGHIESSGPTDDYTGNMDVWVRAEDLPAGQDVLAHVRNNIKGTDRVILQSELDEYGEADTTQVTVGGKTITVPMDPWIYLGAGLSLRLGTPLHLRLGVPPVEIVLNRSNMRINTWSPAGMVNVTEADYVQVKHQLTTLPRDADGRWRRVGHQQNMRQRRHDRQFHRMKTITDDAQWLYEWITVGNYMREMSLRKLGVHGCWDNEDWAAPPAEPSAVPDEEDDEDWNENGPGGTSMWTSLPLWSRPPREPEDGSLTDPELFGGYMDLDSGRPVDKHAFSLTRPCPYCSVITSASPNVSYHKGYNRAIYYPEGTADADIEPVSPSVPSGNGWWTEEFATEEEKLARMAQLEGACLGSVEIVEGLVLDRPYEDISIQTGKQMLQVFCPLACSQRFKRAPRHDPPGTYPTPQQFARAVAAQPSQIRRYIYHACERYVFDSQPYGGIDALAWQALYSLRSPPGSRAILGGDWDISTQTGERNCFAVRYEFYSPGADNHREPDVYNSFNQPLELTTDFFRNSITVAVHAPPTMQWLGEVMGPGDPALTDSERVQYGLVNPLDVVGDPEEDSFDRNRWTWGLFAFASARCFFPAPDGSGDYIANFSYFGQTPADLDEIDRPESPHRQKWLDSSFNHFEPTWTAALIPIREAIRIQDWYPLDEQTGGVDPIEDNNTTLLMRQLRQIHWGKTWAESGDEEQEYLIDPRVERAWNRMYAPPMQRGGGNLDWYGQELEDAIKH